MAPKTLADAEKFWLVIRITSAPAGIMPPTGSINCPQPPASAILALIAATLAAVVAFCTSPCQLCAGQVTVRPAVLIGAAPTLKRTISLYPSVPGVVIQAATNMLSI